MGTNGVLSFSICFEFVVLCNNNNGITQSLRFSSGCQPSEMLRAKFVPINCYENGATLPSFPIDISDVLNLTTPNSTFCMAEMGLGATAPRYKQTNKQTNK